MSRKVIEIADFVNTADCLESCNQRLTQIRMAIVSYLVHKGSDLSLEQQAYITGILQRIHDVGVDMLTLCNVVDGIDGYE